MNRKTIETNMIQTILTYTDQITFFGLGGVVRALVTAVAAAVDELFYDINQVRRKLFIATAEDTDLHERARENNIEPLGAAAAGVVLAFSGTASTVIPAATQVKSASGIIFETVESLTLGTANSPYDTYPCEALTDKVEAIATVTGASGNVPANTVTTLVVPIAGVDAVTNPSQGVGGCDAESDPHLRTRIRERILLLNQGTLAFYEAIAKEINPEVLRVYACKGSAEREVAVYCATRSGTGLTSSERGLLRESIQGYAPINAFVQVYNVTFTDVDVYVRVAIKTGYTLQDVFENILKNLADLVDWGKEDFGAELDDADILSVCVNSEGVKDVDVASFEPGENIQCAKNSLPRLGTIVVYDINTLTSINYSPATSYIYRY